MQAHAPGLVIGSDVGADRFALGRRGRINIFQILMHSGMINSASSAAEQRRLADVLLKPPLANWMDSEYQATLTEYRGLLD